MTPLERIQTAIPHELEISAVAGLGQMNADEARSLWNVAAGVPAGFPGIEISERGEGLVSGGFARRERDGWRVPLQREATSNGLIPLVGRTASGQPPYEKYIATGRENIFEHRGQEYMIRELLSGNPAGSEFRNTEGVRIDDLRTGEVTIVRNDLTRVHGNVDVDGNFVPSQVVYRNGLSVRVTGGDAESVTELTEGCGRVHKPGDWGFTGASLREDGTIECFDDSASARRRTMYTDLTVVERDTEGQISARLGADGQWQTFSAPRTAAEDALAQELTELYRNTEVPGTSTVRFMGESRQPVLVDADGNYLVHVGREGDGPNLGRWYKRDGTTVDVDATSGQVLAVKQPGRLNGQVNEALGTTTMEFQRNSAGAIVGIRETVGTGDPRMWTLDPASGGLIREGEAASGTAGNLQLLHNAAAITAISVDRLGNVAFDHRPQPGSRQETSTVFWTDGRVSTNSSPERVPVWS